MVDDSRQAGASDDETALLRAISEVVVEWFGDSGDYGIPCDQITGDAIARDVLARLKERMMLLSAITYTPCCPERCSD